MTSIWTSEGLQLMGEMMAITTSGEESLNKISSLTVPRKWIPPSPRTWLLLSWTSMLPEAWTRLWRTRTCHRAAGLVHKPIERYTSKEKVPSAMLLRRTICAVARAISLLQRVPRISSRKTNNCALPPAIWKATTRCPQTRQISSLQHLRGIKRSKLRIYSLTSALMEFKQGSET